jgi:hypothetical protein
MNNDNHLGWGFICQVVDKDFYPLGDADFVRLWPRQSIKEAVKEIKSSTGKMINDLGIIGDFVSIDDVGATLWKLSNPYHVAGEGRRVAVEKLLETVRREQQSLVEELDTLLRISRYFDDESLPDGHLHLLLQLSISGVDGAIPF